MERFRKSQLLLALTVLLILLLTSCSFIDENGNFSLHKSTEQSSEVTAGNSSDNSSITNYDELDRANPPVYDGNNYVTINGNIPEFSKDMLSEAGLIVSEKGKWRTSQEGGIFSAVDGKAVKAYEVYEELDSLGRCTKAYGCFGRETMPEDGEERGDISRIRPSGWKSGQNWERCHLVAWAISAENANERNLITGTHYLNYDGMRPFEEAAESYMYGKNHHVLYEVEPVYIGKNLVASGVHMQAASVEDCGKSVSWNVYMFNVTPNATIDYMTGIVTTEEQATQEARLYVLNKRSEVFHYPSCEGAASISSKNRKEITATRTELTGKGYTPCGYCQP
ncbi:MAG: DNA/RNA non-specific endonuclease [Clostridiales bacterium]|nr:DNA/RNA non-specific endonuclease [Candidatus Crickella caballi]